jgi:hypothetical protein
MPWAPPGGLAFFSLDNVTPFFKKKEEIIVSEPFFEWWMANVEVKIGCHQLLVDLKTAVRSIGRLREGRSRPRYT